jgi:hypothetical protein
MILFAAGLAGFAVLAIEVLGVHWLAPWFGTSALVWSNQIGVVLFAMALGGWAGGRQARKATDPLRLGGGLLLTAGLLLVLGLWTMPLLADFLLPDDLALDQAATIFLGGSLGSAILFFAPPVFLLAMLSPLLVEARARSLSAGSASNDSSISGRAGEAAGSVAAVGTLGSLLGVFGSSLFAIPVLGTRTTLALTSIALILAGLLLLRSRSKVVLVAMLLPGLAVFFSRDPGIEANLISGAKVLQSSETSLQRLRVIEFESGERWLQMNEGLDSFQSVWNPDPQKWPGGYYDLFALAPWYSEWELQPWALLDHDQTREVWVLGFAAGSSLGPISKMYADRPWRAVGIEIDPGVRALAEQWMPLPKSLNQRVQIIDGGDARAWLHAAPYDLDVILLDAYANQFEIPLHLATEEFFAEVRSHLRVGGILVLNLGTSESSDSELGFADVVRGGLASVFQNHVRAHQVSRSRNWVLYARRDGSFPSAEEMAAQLPAGLPATLGGALLAGQSLDGPPAGAVGRLSDERNPLALAQARLWLGGAED